MNQKAIRINHSEPDHYPHISSKPVGEFIGGLRHVLRGKCYVTSFDGYSMVFCEREDDHLLVRGSLNQHFVTRTTEVGNGEEG